MNSIFRFIFRAADYQTSLDFYRNKLEFSVIMDWDRSPAERGTVFKVNNGEIEVLAVPPGREYLQPQGFELCIEVPQVDNFCQFVQTKDIRLNSALTDRTWGHRTFSVLDPDGIKLIFFSVI
jgi:catechol 2,3-dioxygenase-like lactoylglutathione lyase family enzyme